MILDASRRSAATFFGAKPVSSRGISEYRRIEQFQKFDFSSHM